LRGLLKGPPGALAVIFLMIWPQVCLLMGELKPVVPYVFSGTVFTEPFRRIHVGHCLDQPTIGKWYFWFTFFLVTGLPYAAGVRWLIDKSSRLCHCAFSILTITGCLCLLCILTIPFCWLLKYINAMGVTPTRIFGLVYAGLGYLVVLGFMAWALVPPRKS